MKKWIAFASVLCLVVVLAACGSNTGGNNSGSSNSGKGAADGQTASSEVILTASNYEFDQEEYRIKAGETVDLTLKSIDGVHGVQILKTDIKKFGKDETVTVNFDKPGTYNIICSVPCGTGHALMKSKLIVE